MIIMYGAVGILSFFPWLRRGYEVERGCKQSMGHYICTMARDIIARMHNEESRSKSKEEKHKTCTTT